MSSCLYLLFMRMGEVLTFGQAESYIAKIGAGQRLGNVALGIHEQGGRALPHGTCAGVGIGKILILKLHCWYEPILIW